MTYSDNDMINFVKYFVITSAVYPKRYNGSMKIMNYYDNNYVEVVFDDSKLQLALSDFNFTIIKPEHAEAK